MSDQELNAQAETILAEGMTNGGVSSTDQTYLTQLVSEHTGLAPADAQARVQDVLNQQQAAITKAKQAADATRKASAAAAIYTFVSLLIGAFIASVAGAIGGRLRDNY
jgi:VIT1/CCC1 family predicted Fe2+/Mn2+ transporter